jgi:hypothetical protein
MKIQLVSDLHSKFFDSTEKAVETTVQILRSDVLIIAWYIGNYETFAPALLRHQP